MTDTRESELRPEFRTHLEWQIASALRREARFAEPVRGGRVRLRTAIAMTAALALGAGAMAATAEVQEARQRDALMEAARTDEALSRLRLQLAEAEVQDARKKFAAGIATREQLHDAEAQMLALKAALARLALNAEEIKATAQPPRDDQQAPLVGERDFVTERLKLDLASLQKTLAAAEATLAETKKRVEVGLAPQLAQLQADTEVLVTQLRMQELVRTIELRQQLLGGQLKAEALAAEVRRLELTMETKRAQYAIEAARARLASIRTQFAAGKVEELELKRAEVEVLERELAMKRLLAELKDIKK
jgi:hypothetical protein